MTIKKNNINSLALWLQYNNIKNESVPRKLNWIILGLSDLKECPIIPDTIAGMVVDEEIIWYILLDNDKGIIVYESNEYA